MRSKKNSKLDILAWGKYKNNFLFNVNFSKTSNYIKHYFKRKKVNIIIIEIYPGELKKYPNTDYKYWDNASLTIQIVNDSLSKKQNKWIKRFNEICFQNEVNLILK